MNARTRRILAQIFGKLGPILFVFLCAFAILQPSIKPPISINSKTSGPLLERQETW